MIEEQQKEILEKSKMFFKENIAKRHLVNTKKLKKTSSFIINPFLVSYLAQFAFGNADAISIARALIYDLGAGRLGNFIAEMKATSRRSRLRKSTMWHVKTSYGSAFSKTVPLLCASP